MRQRKSCPCVPGNVLSGIRASVDNMKTIEGSLNMSRISARTFSRTGATAEAEKRFPFDKHLRFRRLDHVPFSCEKASNNYVEKIIIDVWHSPRPPAPFNCIIFFCGVGFLSNPLHKKWVPFRAWPLRVWSSPGMNIKLQRR